MIWPRATEILAAAATKHGLPFILSTVATASIETVAEITGGKAWFQLYHPVEEDLRNKLLDRVEAAGLPVLVILADTPVFGYRPREIRNGLAMPPKMTLRNIAQMMTRPHWSFAQLATGVPEFATLKPYLPGGLDMKHLGLFMNRTFSGRLNPAKLACATAGKASWSSRASSARRMSRPLSGSASTGSSFPITADASSMPANRPSRR